MGHICSAKILERYFLSSWESWPVFYLLFGQYLKPPLEILKKTPVPKGTVNPALIIELTMKTLQSANYSQIVPVTFLIIFLWILSIIDAYLIGRKKMSNINTPADQQSASPPVFDFANIQIFKIIDSHCARFHEILFEIFLPVRTADFRQYFFNP